EEALYLSALGLLRGSFANEVSFLKKIGWVNETIEMLETARTLTNNEEFLVRWSTGVVYSQLPSLFKKRDTAIKDLNWALENISKAPHLGWSRELYFHLGLIFNKENNHEKAQEFLELSGYDDFDKQIFLTTPYSTNSTKGSVFHPKRIKEIIQGEVFVITGFDFGDFYFILSKDKNELIAVDSGSRPDSAKAAYEYLKENFPDLPQLTTLFTTHSHWDHIGGHSFYRELNPGLKIYARDNYFKELEIAVNVPAQIDYFFGTEFKIEFISGFKPDVTISEQTEVEIGGSLFKIIPTAGGETVDGMIIYLAEHSVLFTGDLIMPYLGSPFNEEGNIVGLFQAIDLVVDLNPKHILHGHEPLTRIFNSTSIFSNLKPNLEWLHEETKAAIRDGKDRASIHHKNLIPPFLNETPEIQLTYLVLRENFINRIYDQYIGYWDNNLQGVDHLSKKEFGAALVHYLNITENELAIAIENMVANGDHELAGWLSELAITQFPESVKLKEQHKAAFIKLKERYQEISPFKFFLYSDVINDDTSQLELK
ncbi:MAG: MBL fold metallo-hydrolase, partial [Candidatus Anammoxibacter sp.]